MAGWAPACWVRPNRPKPPIVWICAALIDGKAYLFDARVGLPSPAPAEKGSPPSTRRWPTRHPRADEPAGPVTLRDQPGLAPGQPDQDRHPDRFQPGLFSPKMKLLQRELPGKNRTILYRDPAEQRDHFAQVLGDRLRFEFKLWEIPLEVETRLFTDAQFVQSTQQSLFLFRPDFPLVLRPDQAASRRA